ncbi:LysR family transcriptional regulator [Croceicoccus estronivorus]|uniref:LysR family transcriptional regulator n=1 Tax=Croceicoccus estronivorus TaxID=1172626 RepID=UPI00082CBDAD|nr:LysR family transcriptional regulator [Croceicoccus estronivorus]OCC22770.1 LysR family transcriptional regulator [Croceicoccus estronivorus]
MKRTHLPLNALRVFDAAARHLSFTRAADELAVTPAAVGQQIRALEDVLGVVLFRRTSKGLELTDEAMAGLDALREGFLHFEESVRAMQAGQASHHYTIAVPRDFFGAWLGERLAAFRADNPDVHYALVDGETSDFTEANLDLAVRLAEGPGELEGIVLGKAEKLRVGAVGRSGEKDLPLIHWQGQGEGAEEDVALSVPDAGQALAAAAAGLGVADVPALLAEKWIAEGRVEPLGEPEPCRRAYWLVAPMPQWRQKKVKALVERLTAG